MIRWVISVAVVVGVAYALRGNIRKVRHEWGRVHFHPVWILACGVCLAGTSLVQLVIFRQLLKAYHGRLSWRGVVVASWVPTLGKYVVVKVGALAVTMYLLGRQGVSATVALSVALIQDALAVIAGLMVAAPLLRRVPLPPHFPRWLGLAAALALGMVFLHPAVFPRLANRVLRLLRRPPLRTPIPLRIYAAPVLITFGQWFFTGLALWCMIRSVARPPISLWQAGLCMEIAALAMTTGYLAVFTLGGLGVQEWIIISSLTPIVGRVSAMVIAVTLRLVQTVVELSLSLLALWLSRELARQAGASQQSGH